MKHLDRFVEQLDISKEVRDVVLRTLDEEERNITYVRPPTILQDLEQMIRDVVNKREKGGDDAD